MEIPSSPAIAPRVKPSSRKSPTARRLNSKENRLLVLGRRATPLGGLILFFFSTELTASSFMLTLHLTLECQPFIRLTRSHDLVVSTLWPLGRPCFQRRPSSQRQPHAHRRQRMASPNRHGGVWIPLLSAELA